MQQNETKSTGNHASIQVVIDDSGMEASIILRNLPDTSLHSSEVISALDAAGVQYGLDTSAVEALIKEASAKDCPDRIEKIVARGKPVSPGRDGVFQRLVKQSDHVAIREDGRADFRNVQKFQTVKKGQNVALIRKPVEGKPGINVKGEEILPEPVMPAPRKGGKNVSEIPGEEIYISRIRGVYTDDGETIDVNPELEIKGDAGIESGNLEYEGTIRVSGNVERGTEIKAGGDLIVDGVVESGRLSIRGNLVVGTGVNTARDGTLHVHGSLESPYIENSVVMVDGPLLVERAILGSHIVCHDMVNVKEESGTISGSEIVSYGSIISGQIGNKSGARSILFTGLHYRNTKNWEKTKKVLERAVKELEHAAAKLRGTQNKVVRYSKTSVPVDVQAQVRADLKYYQETEQKKKKAEAEYQKLIKHRINRSPVQIGARSMIFPGVEIHYAGHIHRITAQQSKVSLIFEPGTDKYKIKSFQESDS